MQNWYLLMTKPREDSRAEQHLQNQGYRILRPMIRRHVVNGKKQVAVTESLFPRYLFIHLDDEVSNWSSIRSTRGVFSIVSFNNMPAVVPDSLITDIQGKVDKDNVLDTTGYTPFIFKPGDKVEITQGCFKGLQAIVEMQQGLERVLLLLNLLGKSQPLAFPLDAVKRYA